MMQFKELLCFLKKKKSKWTELSKHTVSNVQSSVFHLDSQKDLVLWAKGKGRRRSAEASKILQASGILLKIKLSCISWSKITSAIRSIKSVALLGLFSESYRIKLNLFLAHWRMECQNLSDWLFRLQGD